MPIIIGGVITKEGQVLFFRKFAQIPNSIVKQSLRQIPKLIKKQQQHSFVQDQKNRYLYIPAQQVYLIIVTTKNFNIIQAVQVIKTFHRVAINVCKQGINKKSIQNCSFDLILALDDLISLGERQTVSVDQIIRSLSLQSAEEKTYLQQMKKREQEAKQALKKK